MSQIAEQLKGTGVAIVTPFDTKGNVDYKALDKIIQHLIKGKVEYIVSLGTTGETATLDKEEKKKIVAFTVKAVNKRIPVVLGLGGNNTREIIAAFKEFDLSGISAILSVSPYYNKPIKMVSSHIIKPSQKHHHYR
jgi:4-hydroxy-tetrahydrodipicolinate synthase